MRSPQGKWSTSMPSPAEWIRAFLETYQAQAELQQPLTLEQPLPTPFPISIPPFEQHTDFEVDLVRPEDLLNLHIAGFNFHVAGSKAHPKLQRIHADTDALLVVTFPPQSVNESATLEGAPLALPGQPAQAATIVARIAGASRLVFRLPAHAAMPTIPYTIEG